MKYLKFILFIVIGLVLVGCNNTIEDPIDNPVIEPTLSSESLEYSIEEGGTLALNIEVLNSSKDEGIIYFSNDNKIATIDTSGFIRAKSVGTTTVVAMLSNYPDQKIEITINITEPPVADIEKAIADFDAIMEELNQIPDVVRDNLVLNTFMYNRRLIWTSSNIEVISVTGLVKRKSEDIDVKLTATMSYKEINRVFEKVVTVKGVNFKDLKNKKVTFAYAMSTNLDKKHLEKIDVVNYSFAQVSPNSKLNLTPTISTLVRDAHNSGTRVVVAIGGWGGGGFSEMTATKANRETFINSVMDAIKLYGFDGIDYDWEYPSAAEKDNFTLLVKETREAFDNYKPGLILSTAFSASPSGINIRYDVKELNKYLDYFHIMTYDLNNWPANQGYALTRHHANLYSSPQSPGLSADDAIRAYINAGASSEKVIIGVAAYGRKATEIVNSNTGLNVNAKDPTQSIKYDDIYHLLPNNNRDSEYEYFYDEVAEAAWIFNGNTFITFDDERSIQAKTDYVFENQLGGAMYWDYTNDSSGRILEFIYQYLNK